MPKPEQLIEAAERRAKLLAYFNGPEGVKPHTTSQIAEQFDWHPDLARLTLKSLREGKLIDAAGTGGPGHAFAYARLGALGESAQITRKANNAGKSSAINGALSWAEVKNMVAARERAINSMRETIVQFEITRAELFSGTASLKPAEGGKVEEAPRQLDAAAVLHVVRKKKPTIKKRSRRAFTIEQKVAIVKKAHAMREAGKEWSEIAKKVDVVTSQLRHWIADPQIAAAAKKAA